MAAEMLLRIVLFVGPMILGYFALEVFFKIILKRIVACINDYWYQTFDQHSVLDDKDVEAIAAALTGCIIVSIYLNSITQQFFFG